MRPGLAAASCAFVGSAIGGIVRTSGLIARKWEDYVAQLWVEKG